jgi:transposase-like protein
MSRTRRHFSAEQKAQIVRRHLAGKEAVSKLAEELQVQPSQIHAWVNQVLAQAEKALENPQSQRREEHTAQRRMEQLQAKLVQKNEVIAGPPCGRCPMEANVLAKKVNGSAAADKRRLGSP